MNANAYFLILFIFGFDFFSKKGSYAKKMFLCFISHTTHLISLYSHKYIIFLFKKKALANKSLANICCMLFFLKKKIFLHHSEKFIWRYLIHKTYSQTYKHYRSHYSLLGMNKCKMGIYIFCSNFFIYKVVNNLFLFELLW